MGLVLKHLDLETSSSSSVSLGIVQHVCSSSTTSEFPRNRTALLHPCSPDERHSGESGLRAPQLDLHLCHWLVFFPARAQKTTTAGADHTLPPHTTLSLSLSLRSVCPHNPALLLSFGFLNPQYRMYPSASFPHLLFWKKKIFSLTADVWGGT